MNALELVNAEEGVEALRRRTFVMQCHLFFKGALKFAFYQRN